MLKSFLIGNYKGFARTQEIELAPLTLFFGQNSSGKSTLLRVVPWIAESIAERRPGPRLDGDVAREATWDDLVNLRSPLSPIELGLSWEGGYAVDWQIRSGSIGGTCELAKVTCRVGADHASLGDDGDGVWQGPEGPIEAKLQGMMPVGSGVPVAFDTIAEMTSALEVQWVTGVRAPVGRVVSVGGTPPSNLGSDGWNAARHLYFWDRQSSGSAPRAVLQEFFARVGYEIATEDVAQRGGWFRVVVKPISGLGVPVNVVDTGEGFTQVLPALVALGRAASGVGPSIVAVEQPELHLHTNAQRALAETIATVVERGGVQVLAETHSEVLLACVQLAVATKALDHTKVAIYWTSVRPDGTSWAQRINLDPQGKVIGPWPIDAFSDLLRLRTELHHARSGKSQ